MHSFLNAKQMAKILRDALAARGVTLGHAESLELVAHQFGLKDWNTLSAAIARVNGSSEKLPEGWYRTGTSTPELHAIGMEPAEPGTIRIAATAPAQRIGGVFAAIGQSVDATAYRGGKLRLTAMLRGERCDRAATWLRIDGEEAGRALRFDNLVGHADGDGVLVGDFGWTRRTIVLDVPQGARRVVFGALLAGLGTLWIRDIDLREADPWEPTTDLPPYPRDFGGAPISA